MKEKASMKVVVIDLQKGVESSFINSIERYFGKDVETYVKSVSILDLNREFEYQPAQQVICMPAVGLWLQEIMQRWTAHYPNSATKFLVLGKTGEQTDLIVYAEDLDAWIREEKRNKKRVKAEAIKK